jgi:hypothetical protein
MNVMISFVTACNVNARTDGWSVKPDAGCDTDDSFATSRGYDSQSSKRFALGDAADGSDQAATDTMEAVQFKLMKRRDLCVRGADRGVP